ncbi:MAG: EAL domain-containing protein [Trueperaceae bacterium]
MTTPKRAANGETVLIVEDSRTQAEQLRALLEYREYEVLYATDGVEALALARKEKPALVISDIVMPRMDGYELCRNLKSDEELKEIPVILVTTLADSQDVIRGLECGADNFLRKPYEERYLLSRLDYLLMNKALRKEQRMQMGVEINLGGKRHFINAERQQILDLLISTYEQAVDLNAELSRRQAELGRANRVLAGLYELGQGLNRATSIKAVAEVALDRLQRLTGIEGGWISLWDERSELTVIVERNVEAGVEMARIDTQPLHQSAEEPNNGFAFEPLSSDAPPDSSHLLIARIPLHLGNRNLGMLNLLATGSEVLEEGSLRGIEGVGNQVAVALERARLHEQLERLVEERTAELKAEVVERKRHEDRVVRLNRLYSLLSGINSTIVHSQQRDELFRRACEIAVELGGFRFAWIGLVESRSGRPQVAAQAGGSELFLPLVELSTVQHLPDSADLLKQSLELGRPVICNDIAADQLLSWRNEALALDCRSVAVLPLKLDDEPMGTFTLFSDEVNLFDEEELRLLDEIAGDISFALEHLRKDEQLHELAFYDEHTRLPNRTLVLERLREMIGARGEDRPIGIAMLDLDRFKTINDSLGHDTGNRFLRTVGNRLQRLVGEAETVGRVAGDEFALLLPQVEDASDLAKIAARVVFGIREPLRVDGYELFTGASVGLALYPADGDTAEDLLEKADLAMYRAKGDGGDSYQFYTSRMGTAADEKLALETSMRQAFESDEFLLHYQPVVDLQSNAVIGLEALVRWHYRKQKMLPPGDFIPLAEETGLVVQLGEWVLRAACKQGKRWSALFPTPPRIKVNISPRQFRQQNLFGTVRKILEETGLDPQLLTLEITENHLMQDIDTALSIMEKLGELGVQFSIDDFGTGYSSFSYLSRLRIDSLKIDRSFVRHLPASQREATLVTAMITMAQKMGLSVIAEGIETKEQLDYLLSQGCDAGQGFYLGRPMPAQEIERFVTQGAANSGRQG